jgi:hypothetical protein
MPLLLLLLLVMQVASLLVKLLVNCWAPSQYVGQLLITQVLLLRQLHHAMGTAAAVAA